MRNKRPFQEKDREKKFERKPPRNNTRTSTSTNTSTNTSSRTSTNTRTRTSTNTSAPLHAQKSNELKYYGFHACLNLWKARPNDVIRVYVDEKRVKEASPLLKWCANNAKAYHIVSDEELAKVSDSVHHEGLCVLAKEPTPSNFQEMIKHFSTNKDAACILYLDGVQNPHNIGSIMRVAAHFGIRYVIGQKALLPKVSPSAYRVAQGGAEHVKLIAIDEIKPSFDQLEKLGFKAVASSSHGNNSLYEHQFAPRTIMVMGSESEGVNKKLMESVKKTLLIPGSGLVESLNVSVATGLFLGEYFRQVGQRKNG